MVVIVNDNEWVLKNIMCSISLISLENSFYYIY